MDAEQLLVAADFVDKLIDLHVVDTPDEGWAVLTTVMLPSSWFPRKARTVNGE